MFETIKNFDQKIHFIITIIKNKILNLLNTLFDVNPNFWIKILLKINKCLNLLLIKFPSLYKFFLSIYNFYKLNNFFIWQSVRFYFYICIILYAITWFVFTITLFLQNSDLFWLSEILIFIYNNWTKPLGSYRFLIKYVFLIPFYIFKFFFFNTVSFI